MNKFRKLGFIEYNGKIEIHNLTISTFFGMEAIACLNEVKVKNLFPLYLFSRTSWGQYFRQLHGQPIAVVTSIHSLANGSLSFS